MTFHVFGYTQSQDSAVLVPTAGLLDQSLQVNGNDVIIPDDLTNIIGVYAVGPNATRVSLQSPSLRRMFNQEIEPLDIAAIATDQLLLNWFGDSPLIVDAGEPFEVWMAENNAAASRVTSLLWIADTPPQPIVADIHSIRVTATGTAVANAWTNMNLTFNDVLPSGTYALVGACMQSATIQGFRFVFKQAGYRPGAIGQATVGTRLNPVFRNGGLGIWGQFENLTPPSMDVLCNAGDTAFAGVLDLVQVASARG